MKDEQTYSVCAGEEAVEFDWEGFDDILFLRETSNLLLNLGADGEEDVTWTIVLGTEEACNINTMICI